MAYGNYYGVPSPYQNPFYPVAPVVPQSADNYAQQQRGGQFTPPTQNNPPTSQNSIVWANNTQEAEDFMLIPNNTVLIMTKDMKNLYIKSSDSLGRIKTDVYRCSKVEIPNDNNVTDSKPQSDENADQYVTRKELESILENLNGFVTKTELDETLSNISVSAKVTNSTKKSDKSTKEE